MDQTGWDALIVSCLPRLTQFAERQLPAATRARLGADDVVQEALMKSMRQRHRFEFRHQEALMAYLRTSIRHCIVDEIRRVRRRPELVPLNGCEWVVDRGVSPLQRVIARSDAGRYKRALAGLRDRDRQLVELRLEHGLSYLEIAVRLGMRSQSSVRVAIRRALERLGATLNRVQCDSFGPSR
jgi:RNA polymerase sigma factor (sigma-70 family)